MSGVINSGFSFGPSTSMSGQVPAGAFDDDLKSLECQVCLQVRRGCKIFQCVNGHIICEHCGVAFSGTECPICSQATMAGGARIRNLVVEQEIQRLPEQCPNRERGCAFDTRYTLN